MAYPTSTQKRLPPNVQRQRERLEGLVDDRGPDRPQTAAVIREDVASLGTVKLRANFLTASPTMADYNNLVEDQRALASLLNKLGASFTWQS